MNVELSDLTALLEDAVRMTVHQTLAEMRKNGFIKAPDAIMYDSAAKLIKGYYDDIKSGKPGDQEISDALKSISKDEYHGIIYLYYYVGMTNEEIAEEYDCEPSTIKRNKKRLCIEIYNKISRL